jgi:hypothetical protein
MFYFHKKYEQQQKTKQKQITPQRFIEVPVPGQESERSCKCMLEESITTLSTILVLGFWNCSDSVEFAFCFFAFFCFCFVFCCCSYFL